ncbi:hypothetical protein DFP72DRAFT_1172322 [Ephemerocybe angulata]|uniref:Uncharacterized protein n=1 Tax=Ephemerocybe angulata TaxID=980116 RepID=A0A8H6HQQ3_9AGAR|nr:hypothetical protein DFP72DRAFT_1172322 [Tulosesus angulatus]
MRPSLLRHIALSLTAAQAVLTLPILTTTNPAVSLPTPSISSPALHRRQIDALAWADGIAAGTSTKAPTAPVPDENGVQGSIRLRRSGRNQFHTVFKLARDLHIDVGNSTTNDWETGTFFRPS